MILYYIDIVTPLPGNIGLVAPVDDGGALDDGVEEEDVAGAGDGCDGAHGLGKGAVLVVPCGAAGGGGAELAAINSVHLTTQHGRLTLTSAKQWITL